MPRASVEVHAAPEPLSVMVAVIFCDTVSSTSGFEFEQLVLKLMHTIAAMAAKIRFRFIMCVFSG